MKFKIFMIYKFHNMKEDNFYDLTLSLTQNCQKSTYALLELDPSIRGTTFTLVEISG